MNRPLTIDLPGRFDGFFEGTSEAQGDNGKTPLYLAYQTGKIINRSRGYSMRLTLPTEDAEEILRVLREYAGDCIYFNQDQMREPGTQAEVAAARLVINRCDVLLEKVTS